MNSEGKWVFNSSAAEQANAWFGKFQNIVQDMSVLKWALISERVKVAANLILDTLSFSMK